MDYIIGVDGGGTKTEAVAYDLSGEVLARALTGFGNLVNGKEEALNNITTSIEELIIKLGQDGENAKLIYNEVKNKFSLEPVVMNEDRKSVV